MSGHTINTGWLWDCANQATELTRGNSRDRTSRDLNNNENVNILMCGGDDPRMRSRYCAVYISNTCALFIYIIAHETL